MPTSSRTPAAEPGTEAETQGADQSFWSRQSGDEGELLSGSRSWFRQRRNGSPGELGSWKQGAWGKIRHPRLKTSAGIQPCSLARWSQACQGFAN